MAEHTIERAFELARSGAYLKVQEIRRQLLRERYDNVDLHLAGAFTRRQLLDAATEARRVGG